MTVRPVIHVLEDVHPSAMVRLRENAHVLTEDVPFPSECDGVIVRARSITANDISACPNLKVIGKHGAGLDAIDLRAADARNIAVVSTPGANADSVADLAIAFSLALIRNVYPVTFALKNGTSVDPAFRTGWELGELSAGIFGLGAVGRATATRLASGFGATVHAFDPGVPANEWPAGVARKTELSELLKMSRILFVHVPLLPQTRRCVNADTLARMPSGSYVVNCSRGGVVDETALAAALDSGHINGAASDVFEEEPPSAANPLLQQPNFLATPHIGASTNGALERVGLSVVEKVITHLGSCDRSATSHRPRKSEEE